MHTEGDQVHISTEEVSGGSREGVVRWVLVIGLILVVGALSLIWITGALSSTDPNADNANVSAKIAAEEDQAAGSETLLPEGTAETGEREVENGVPVVNN